MDDDQSGAWMSYVELGQMRGITKESALKLALRRGWRKQLSNTGVVRVCVPPGFADQRDTGADKEFGAVDMPVDIERIVNGLGDALTTLREQLATAHAANLRIVEDMDGVRAQASVVAAELGIASQEREIARIEAASGKAEVRVLREALAEARRSWWQRILGKS